MCLYGEILANMTQVSNVAHEPLVFIDMSSDRKILLYCNNIVYAAWLRNDHFYYLVELHNIQW
jgi:hypothetical protein